ncbi:hypothetical protein Bca101_044884 [Brassica carinata]
MLFCEESLSLVPLRNVVHIAAGEDFNQAIYKFRKAVCLPPTGITGDILPWIIWTIWTSRNAMVFENRSSTPEETATKRNSLAREWNQGQGAEPKQTSHTHLSHRIAQGPSRIQHSEEITTCKTDAAWDKNRSKAGLAWIFTGSHLTPRLQGSLVHDHVRSPLMAEALALHQTLLKAVDIGISSLKIYSDNATLIGAINKKLQRKKLIGIISDIQLISSEFISISFSHLSRVDNTIADSLAKAALVSSFSGPQNPFV